MKILVIIVIVVATVGAFLLLKNSTSQKTDNANLSVQEQEVTPQSSDTAAAKGNFSQKGNLAVENSNWVLLWDEPGKMALNVKIKFDAQSACLLNGGKKDCSLLDKSGNYYVSIEGNKTGDEVVVTKLEQIEIPQ